MNRSHTHYSGVFFFWFWTSKLRLGLLCNTRTTFLTGYYAYLETSKRQRNLFATLSSPIYAGSFAQCDIVFWYHMYGNNVGVLKLDLVNFYLAVDMPQYTTLFELRGMKNSNSFKCAWRRSFSTLLYLWFFFRLIQIHVILHMLIYPYVTVETISLQLILVTQLTFTCSTSTIETTEKVWNMFKVNNKNTIIDIVLVFLLLTLNLFHTFFYCFFCWLWKSKC